ncbi:MAG: hypothetical protein U0234_03320 [Sandaracinus sp.]
MRFWPTARWLTLTLAVTACHPANGPGCEAAECACVSGACTCPDGRSCGWSAVGGCDDASAACHLSCLTQACNGRCGDACEATCLGGATCDVQATGPSTSYVCRQSSCQLALDTGVVQCAVSAICNVRCAGACSVSCDDTSTCELSCAGGAPTTVRDGFGSCP